MESFHYSGLNLKMTKLEVGIFKLNIIFFYNYSVLRMLSFVSETLTCGENDFDCRHSVCVSGSWHCDYQMNCINGNIANNCGK